MVSNYIRAHNLEGEEMVLRASRAKARLSMLLVALAAVIPAFFGLGPIFTINSDQQKAALASGAVYGLCGLCHYKAFGTLNALEQSLFEKSDLVFILVLDYLLFATSPTTFQWILISSLATVWLVLFTKDLRRGFRYEEGGHSKEKGKTWRAMLWAMASAFFSALTSVFNEHLLANFNSLDAFCMTRWGLILITPLILGGISSGRQTLKELATLRKEKKEVLLWFLRIQAIRIVLLYFNFLAIQISGSAAVVLALGALTPIYCWVIKLRKREVLLFDSEGNYYLLAILICASGIVAAFLLG
jgi:uncharacterized membrane protein